MVGCWSGPSTRSGSALPDHPPPEPVAGGMHGCSFAPHHRANAVEAKDSLGLPVNAPRAPAVQAVGLELCDLLKQVRCGCSGCGSRADHVLASAILDRLLHHATTIHMCGNSDGLRQKQPTGTPPTRDVSQRGEVIRKPHGHKGGVRSTGVLEIVTLGMCGLLSWH
ncbi:MAG: hypothetical protein GFH27_549301n280 [Chloroflexi bacterium AL-W]|nr:hypothetical protein [Chloroflexi bacterium AL-N1]NOK68474.1 hypothetical protein [Chloroflexi bacterium AL-N10]NOK74120.1 hypothetical protein [Chloroflexi bacterium AL-N5]NOK83087.1 hypothetical protein [Chloroflexi bacterium AL-W]NOK90610.1 hypothetical protein [Chloroflexi bacterium AL-N15]